ncbi:MAG: PAS domain S-box protein [Bacteroidota bacterium]
MRVPKSTEVGSELLAHQRLPDGGGASPFAHVSDAFERLARRETLYRRLVETTSDGVWVIDTAHRTTFVNDAMADMLGYAKASLLTMTIYDVVDPQMHATLDENRRNRVAGASDEYELPLQHADGTTVWAFIRATPLHAPEGAYEGVFAIVTNVTEQRAQRHALQRSEARLETMLHSITDAFIAVDKAWTIIAMNPQAEPLLDAKRETLIGQNLWDSYPEARETTFYHNYHRAIKEQVTVRFEEYYPPLDTWFEVRAFPFDGGLSVYFTDITPRKLYEAKLESTAAALEQRNKELEQFAYIASHDLKSPLHSISGLVKQFRNRYGAAVEEVGRQYLDFIGEGVDRMARLIDDLLHFSRASNKALKLQPVELEAVVRVQLHHVEAQVLATGATVTVEALPVVLADGRYLGQVFQNLLSNALAYHRPGVAPVVQISATQEAGYWRIDVCDNGIGIAEAHQDRIFDIFQRLHTEEDYPGTGIGLAICQRVVERHGGMLSVTSVPGEGSTFSVRLPAVAQQSARLSA